MLGLWPPFLGRSRSRQPLPPPLPPELLAWELTSAPRLHSVSSKLGVPRVHENVGGVQGEHAPPPPPNHNREVAVPEPARVPDFCCRRRGPAARPSHARRRAVDIPESSPPDPAQQGSGHGGRRRGTRQNQARPWALLPKWPRVSPRISPGSIPHCVPEPARSAWHRPGQPPPGRTCVGPACSPWWTSQHGASVMGRLRGHVHFTGFPAALMGRWRPAKPRASHPSSNHG